MTVLDVGHGSAVLLELPDGTLSLYDCGSLSGGDRAADAVAGAVRAAGRARLDSVIVSHADADHFNGVPALLDLVPIGRVVLGPRFAAGGQDDAVALLDLLDDRGVPIDRVAAGARRRAGPTVLTVRHPPPERPPGVSDNARSVVIQIEHAGRTVLLTGDLEGPAQTALTAALAAGGVRADVLLAPHHGGKSSNPAGLPAALAPRIVIASGGRHASRPYLAGVYAGRGVVPHRRRRRGDGHDRRGREALRPIVPPAVGRAVSRRDRRRPCRSWGRPRRAAVRRRSRR